MFLAYLTMITALAISAVAIYYSVAGLAAIFAAAVIPIIIMGGILEVAKLVTAVWLHRYWSRSVWWLKTYLSLAVLVLMFITSMGIFGFLSRAHIEQTSLSIEQVAQAEQLADQLDRSEQRVARWNEELDRLLRGSDVRVDSLLEREQTELDTIYARIDREKTQLRADAENRIEIQNNRLSQAQERKEQDIRVATERFGETDSELLDEAIQRATQNELSVASAVQREIISINRNLTEQLAQVDERFQSQLDDIQNRISQLRSQSNNQTDDIDQRISQIEQQIAAEQPVLADLRQQKADAEREYRKLEAEVGPIKYIAEFIYGDRADKDMLEEAVRWVIIIIIFVFDPLAVLLLIASQYTFGFHRPAPKIDPPTVIPPSPRPVEPEPESEVENQEETIEELDQVKKKDNQTDLEKRKAYYQEAEKHASWNDAKTAWKAEHPNETLKEYKRKYIRGQIDELPWEKYQQNGEQSSNSIWQKIHAQNNNNNPT